MKSRILVIEDNPDNLQLMTYLLYHHHYSVLFATNGEDGLASIKRELPDLVICDIEIPTLTAYEIVKQAKEDPSLKNIPIIAVTTHSIADELENVLSAGFDGYIAKQIEPEKFVEQIDAFLLQPRQRFKESKSISRRKLKDKPEGGILIVDNRAINREFLVNLLSYCNRDLIEASDGQEALKIVAEKHPDLIITDILLPNMDGYEFVQRLRANPETSKLSVIFYTSTYKQDEAKLLANKCNVDFVLPNPSEPRLIIDTVNKALGIHETEPYLQTITKNILPSKSNIAGVELNEIGGRISSYFANIESTKNTFCKIIYEMESIAAERDRLRKFADTFTQNLEDLKNVSGRLFSLLELNYKLATERDINNLLKLFASNACRIVNAHYCILGIFAEGDARKLKYYYLADMNEVQTKQPEPAIDTNSGFIGELLKSRDAVVKNILPEAPLELSRIHPLAKNLLGSPILTPNRVYGFIYFVDKTGGNDFKDIDIELVGNLARGIAVLYENMELYDVIQRHAAKLQIAVTEKENALSGLLASETLFRQFAENIDEVFWRGTANLEKIIYVSPAFEKIWGINKEEVYKEPHAWLDSIIPEDRPKVWEAFFVTIKTTPNVSIEYRIKKPDGTIRNIYDRGFQLKDETGKLVSIIGIATDVTEQHHLRSQALLNDKLTTVGTLAAGVAHEINNPVTWILSNLNIIKNKYSAMSSKEIVELITESIDGVERINEIARNLKGFARIDEDQVSSIDIHQILNAAIEMSMPIIKFRARVEKVYSTSIPQLASNSGKLHQVFLNLILNAAQAIVVGQVEKNLIRVETSMENETLKVEISDTGSGIPDDILPKIFEPFFTTKPLGVGSGMGLAISWDIVKSYDGQITVKTTPLKGTIFTVYLPLKVPALASKPMPKFIPNYRSGSRSILLVDDEPYLLKSMQRILQDKHRVTIALGGEAALQILKKNGDEFDIIITDLNMPNVTGEDIYHYVARQFPGKEQDIIFMSGGIYFQNLKLFMNSISNPCLEKPFNADELQEEINRYSLEQHKV